MNNANIFISSFFLKNFINFNVAKAAWLNFKKLNMRNGRQKYLVKHKSGIMGFKMVFKGRFSRKQRASKATLIVGKVPLNTLKVNIDYNFLTVPLKNSIVSLKIYMYRNPCYAGFKNSITI